MLYVGYSDPLPSQLRRLLGGAPVELDNKALEAFGFAPGEGAERAEVGLEALFPSLGGLYAGSAGRECVGAFVR